MVSYAETLISEINAYKRSENIKATRLLLFAEDLANTNSKKNSGKIRMLNDIKKNTTDNLSANLTTVEYIIEMLRTAGNVRMDYNVKFLRANKTSGYMVYSEFLNEYFNAISDINGIIRMLSKTVSFDVEYEDNTGGV